jgi:hypothetical protein
VFRVWLPTPLADEVRLLAVEHDGIGPLLRFMIRSWLRQHRELAA